MAIAAPTGSSTPVVVPEAVPERRTGWWVLRVVVSAHTVAIFGQPAFAGVYLSGDYDGLRWHELGADVTTTLGYVQLVVAIVVWVRIHRPWPFLATSILVVAETVQYVAGMRGALWLHLPLGVSTVAALAVVFVAVWRRPPPARSRAPRDAAPTRTRPTAQEAGNA